MKATNFNPVDFEPVRQIALQFPGASDSLSHYDTPSIKIKKNLLCRLHENGEWLAVRDYPYICLYINSYSRELLKEVLETGFKAITAKKKK
jgi:hypothetical protein